MNQSEKLALETLVLLLIFKRNPTYQYEREHPRLRRVLPVRPEPPRPAGAEQKLVEQAAEEGAHAEELHGDGGPEGRPQVRLRRALEERQRQVDKVGGVEGAAQPRPLVQGVQADLAGAGGELLGNWGGNNNYFG